MTPIGYFYSNANERYQAARQPGLDASTGIIRLEPGNNYEQALDDLAGFDRIWVIFLFDRNDTWRPKVNPPRGDQNRGVFATRSPHRPNPIGLSCVELISIEGLSLAIGSNDLLDKTPVLDIKPYIPAVDSFPDVAAGWLEELEKEEIYTVTWGARALDQLQFILGHQGPDLNKLTHYRLTRSPLPGKNRRINKLEHPLFELAIKTWRLRYTLSENKVTIVEIISGYSDDALALIEDRWGDKQLHREFRIFKFAKGN